MNSSTDNLLDAGPTLHSYRVFVFDGNRCLRRTALIECANDKEAIGKVTDISGGFLRGWRVELWHLARRVFARQVGVLVTLLASDPSNGVLDLLGWLSP